MALLPIALGALGALAGSQGSQSSQTTTRNLAPESDLEKRIASMQPGQLGALTGMVNAGPGQTDVSAGLNSQRGLAAMLQQYAQGGYLPSEADTAQARQFASTQMQPQQVALQQAFEGQNQRAAQLASQLGRPVNDPIIQARLAQEQMRQGAQLSAQEGAMASQFAMQMPQQRLGYTAQLADVNSNLASQAMANRQALLSLGSQLQNNERNWRLGSSTSTTSQTGGGGLAGAISGGLAGFGSGMSIANMFGGGQAQGTQQQPTGGTGYLGVNTSFGAPSQPAASRFTPSASSFAQPSIGSSGFPAFAQQQSYTGTQALGVGLPQFMQPAFNVYNPINLGPLK